MELNIINIIPYVHKLIMKKFFLNSYQIAWVVVDGKQHPAVKENNKQMHKKDPGENSEVLVLADWI